MLRHSARNLARQLRNGPNKSTALLNALQQSSSCDSVRRAPGVPDGRRDISSVHPTPTASRGKGRRGFGTFVDVPRLQGIAEPVESVHLPSDIVPDDLVINRAQQLKVKPVLDAMTLKFGAEYTDHMLQITWKEGVGWAAPSIDPIGSIAVHPCAQVLHYGMGCFEGMKAFKDTDGKIRLFRPDMNMNRMARSAARLALPTFDKESLLDCIKALVRVERDWIPDVEGCSLYIRPTIISTHPHLGLGPPRSATIFCVLSPVGPYFPSGLKPVKLFVDKKHVRAFPGGIGDAKAGSNYAPTILPQMMAAKRGCSQVLYVLDDGLDGGAIGESGAMNVFFLLNHKGKMELATPDLNGVILPGVTRDSVLALTRSFGDIQVSERRLSWDEIKEAGESGNILEVFGTGTACMIQPITGLIEEDGREISIPFDNRAASHWMHKAPATGSSKGDDPFNLCGRLTRALMDIQYGHTSSPWSVPVED